MKISNAKRKEFWDMLSVFKHKLDHIKGCVQNEMELTEEDLLNLEHSTNVFIEDLITVKELIIKEYRSKE